MVLGALEAGGTKMVCAIGNEKGEILEQISIPTETPEITVPKLLSFFKGKEIEALGIGCFGPIDVDRTSETYGYITTTPKLAWQNCDIVGAFKRELGVPVGFDTDVNGSALGEYTWGIAKGLHSCIYITIGTGVGVGVIVDGNLIHGMMHPEGGHVLLNRHPEDTYEGFCPFHKNCMEGLAAGPAIEGRWGQESSRACRQGRGLGDGGVLYCAGACGLYHACFPAAHHTWRRRHASDTASAAGAREV